jgi:3-oxoadipate enol-lactonase
MPKVQVADGEIHYEEVGAGEPMLLLHGLGSCLEDWELQIPVFAREHRVISMDLRGHGTSLKPSGPYSMAQLARDARAVLEATRTGPVHVVGLSLGGMVAFQLAVDAPELVRSLVIVNSAPEVIARTLNERLMLLTRRVLFAVLGLKGLAGRIAQMNFPRPDQADLRQKLVDRLVANDPVAYAATMKAIVGWSVADRIGNIRCPTLIISADHDYTPVSHKEAYAAKIPGARVAVIANSRHVSPIDQPEELNRLVLEFLGGQVATARTATLP